jgi:hypothetical protein
MIRLIRSSRLKSKIGVRLHVAKPRLARQAERFIDGVARQVSAWWAIPFLS